MSITFAAHHLGLPTGTWIVDPEHSTVGFRVKHMGIETVAGRFAAFAGRIDVPAQGGAIAASGTVEVASVDTGVSARDADLRSESFFAADRHPHITFVATGAVPDGEGGFRLHGELTLRGVTRPIALAVTFGGTGIDDDGRRRIALEAEGELSRREFGMTYDVRVPGGNALVGDRVRLLLDISAVDGA